jgi:hypothetical protein
MTIEKDEKPKKNLTAAIYEGLSVVLFLGVAGYAFKEHNPKEILAWGIIPLIPFIISMFYRSNEIGNNLKKVGLAFAGIFAYLDSIGINGLPAMAILLLAALFIGNLFSTEKVWAEMMKIVGGIASGSLAQAKITSHKSNKKTK